MVFSTYLDSRDQLLRLNLSFWELSEVVAHSGVVAKVDLVGNEDDGGDKKHDVITFSRLMLKRKPGDFGKVWQVA